MVNGSRIVPRCLFSGPFSLVSVYPYIFLYLVISKFRSKQVSLHLFQWVGETFVSSFSFHLANTLHGWQIFTFKMVSLVSITLLAALAARVTRRKITFFKILGYYKNCLGTALTCWVNLSLYQLIITVITKLFLSVPHLKQAYLKFFPDQSPALRGIFATRQIWIPFSVKTQMWLTFKSKETQKYYWRVECVNQFLHLVHVLIVFKHV